MTSELRPAVAVWIDAKEAYARSHKPDPKDSRVTFADPFAAAAVIEADREAVRAEQAAELAQLRAELEAHGEVIAEQLEIRQRNEAELAKFKALAETLAGALGVAASCLSQCAEGLATQNDMETWAEDVAEALREYKEARDAS